MSSDDCLDGVAQCPSRVRVDRVAPGVERGDLVVTPCEAEHAHRYAALGTIHDDDKVRRHLQFSGIYLLVSATVTSSAEDAFGADIDFAQLIKVYQSQPDVDTVRPYRPPTCTGALP